MTELFLILIGTVLVNNFVLMKFLGLCPFMGVSRKLETALGMGMATTFVLTLSSVCSYLVNEFLLQPLSLGIHFFPTEAHDLVQKHLQQPVVSNDLQGSFAAALR